MIALAPQFVLPQDGHDKQDCELAAAGRWLDQWGAHYSSWRITYLGDDLYCHQPHCERVLSQYANFLFTCKPDSHLTLYEWVADLSRNGEVTPVVRSRRIGKKPVTDTYRFVNQVPLRNTDDALMVNWFELVTTDQDGAVGRQRGPMVRNRGQSGSLVRTRRIALARTATSNSRIATRGVRNDSC